MPGARARTTRTARSGHRARRHGGGRAARAGGSRARARELAARLGLLPDGHDHAHRAAELSLAVALLRTAGHVELAPTAGEGLGERPPVTGGAPVVGHEDRGCSPATLAACDVVAFLPQLGKVGSLNVATATSIACYEVRRRAWTATAEHGDDPSGTHEPGSPGVQ